MTRLSKAEAETHNQIAPYLVNKGLKFDSELTVNTLLPTYPSLIPIDIGVMDTSSSENRIPSLKRLKSSVNSQIFDEVKTLELSFKNERDINMSTIEPDSIKYLQKLIAFPGFQKVIDNFKLELTQLLDSLRLNELIKPKQNLLPRCRIELEPALNMSLQTPTSIFCTQLEIILEELNSTFRDFLLPPCFCKSKIQHLASMIYDDIALEDDYIAAKSILLLRDNISSIQIYFGAETIPNPVRYFQEKKLLTIYVRINSDNPNELEYPNKNQILDFLGEIILQAQIKQLRIISRNNTLFETKVILEKIHNPGISTLLRIHLICLELIIWNIIASLKLLEKAHPNIRFRKINLVLDASTTLESLFDIKAQESSLTVVLSIKNSERDMIPSFSDLYHTLAFNLLGVDLNTMKALDHIEPKQIPLLSFERGEGLNFIKCEINLDDIPSRPLQDPLQADIQLYCIGVIDLIGYEPDDVKRKLTPNKKRLSLRYKPQNNMPAQPYLFCCLVDKKYFFKIILLNYYDLEGMIPALTNNLFQGSKSSNQNLSLASRAMLMTKNYISPGPVKKAIKEDIYFICHPTHDLIPINVASYSTYLTIQNIEGYTPEIQKEGFVIRSKRLDNENILFIIKSSLSIRVRVSVNKDMMSFYDYLEFYDLDFYSASSLCLAKTRVFFNEFSEYHSKRGRNGKSRITNKNVYKIYTNLDQEYLRKGKSLIVNNLQSRVQMTDKELENFTNTNIMQTLYDSRYTCAGEERKEKLQFCDKDGGICDIENPTEFQVMFVHNRDSRIIVEGKIIQEDKRIYAVWTPQLKGTYT